MSEPEECSCKKGSNPLRNLWKKLRKKKCDCISNSSSATMSEDQKVKVDNVSTDDDEEEVKISAEMMASMTVSRPHTQVDYIHHLVPNLQEITSCSFYWGKMDRYEAEALLEAKPEGSFLLRDSAQEEYLFSVSFRRYGRSLHARIEEQGHKFSFDCHDPGVFMSKNIPELLDHYKKKKTECVLDADPMMDPASCMFF